MDSRNAHTEAEARALTYTFLSHAFLEEVTVEFLGQLAAQPPSLEGELSKFAAELSPDGLVAARRDVVADFSALFLGMSANPVSPYESVYTSSKRIMMQESRDQVVALYQAEGFRRSAQINLPEDHIGFELEFMACLCRKEAAALQAVDAAAAGSAVGAQKAFLSEHLLVWAPQCCDDVERQARTGFFRGLAQTLREFLALEKDSLSL